MCTTAFEHLEVFGIQMTLNQLHFRTDKILLPELNTKHADITIEELAR